MYIFAKGVKENRDRLKGKTITQFSKHLEGEGWPSEFHNEEARDRIKHAEKRNYYSLKYENYIGISKRMGLATHRYDGIHKKEERVAKLAKAKGCKTGDKFTRKERKRMFGFKGD